MTEGPDDPRRAIPQVDRLTREIEHEAAGLPRPIVVEAARAAVEAARAGRGMSAAEVVLVAREELTRRRRRLLARVINATGVVLHTNLGRAPLHPRAVAAVARVASGYSNLELDLASGRRGDRYEHVEPLVALATGAQAALVVNNNAAAVLLVCACLAGGRQVVISRGELIEIGGEFRIPEVLAASGAVLREVGTTNRTHLRDYESALGDATALVLKVHPSNYRVVGFTAAPDVADLASLCRARGVPLVHDVGSGLVGARLADEPEVSRSLSDGADLVCFSGDKLLGGPQAGIVCGRADLVALLRRHPLVRALRPDKMTLAALGETLALYLDGSRDDLPVWRMIGAAHGDLETRCDALAGALRASGVTALLAEGESVTGGGSLPGVGIAGPLVRVDPGRVGAEALAAALRRGNPPVIARVDAGALVVDLRTVDPSDDDVVARALLDAHSGARRPG